MSELDEGARQRSGEHGKPPFREQNRGIDPITQPLRLGILHTEDEEVSTVTSKVGPDNQAVGA